MNWDSRPGSQELLTETCISCVTVDAVVFRPSGSSSRPSSPRTSRIQPLSPFPSTSQPSEHSGQAGTRSATCRNGTLRRSTLGYRKLDTQGLMSARLDLGRPPGLVRGCDSDAGFAKRVENFFSCRKAGHQHIDLSWLPWATARGTRRSPRPRRKTASVPPVAAITEITMVIQSDE